MFIVLERRAVDELVRLITLISKKIDATGTVVLESKDRRLQVELHEAGVQS